jgi:ATP-binding cassette, subfamily B, bacterial
VTVGDASSSAPPARRRRGASLGAVVRAFRLVRAAAPRELTAAIVLQVLAGLSVAVQLVLVRAVLQQVLDAADRDEPLGSIVLPVLALAGTLAFVRFVQTTQTERRRLLGELVSRHAMDRILDVTCSVEQEAFDDPVFHDHLTRARTNAASRPVEITSGLLAVVAALAIAASVIASLLVIAPVLLPVLALGGVPLWMATSRNARHQFRFAFRLTPSDRERFYLQQVLTDKAHSKEVRAFDLPEFLRRRYDRLYDERVAHLRALVRTRLRNSLIANVASAAILTSALLLLVWLVDRGSVDVADAGAAAFGVYFLAGTLRSVGTATNQLQESVLFLDDVEDFVALAPPGRSARPAPTHRTPPEPVEVVVEDVSFSYPGIARPALRGASVRLGRGEVVALVGENGSGKTTLAKLLCGLYRPTAGRIVWNGTDTAELPLGRLREDVAIVFQDFARYELSAEDNVALGRHERAGDRSAVEAAARLAGAHDFVHALPDGYGTRLSRAFTAGAELSIGQWQRLALARAFFRDAGFLVFDEPTSALDPRAEQELFETVQRLAAGRTVLLVSHRFSTVRSADRIYVLGEGRVVEEGDHATLMALRGHYAELYTLQAAAYAD